MDMFVNWHDEILIFNNHKVTETSNLTVSLTKRSK